MSKKQRRKSLNKKTGPVERGSFAVDSSKMYIAAAIVMFHIVPLVFVMMGETGKLLLSQTFMFMLNPIFIFLDGLLYGVRIGFEWKFPLILTVLAAASIAMYYSFESVNHVILTVMIEFIVYGVFSYISVLAGSFVKKYI